MIRRSIFNTKARKSTKARKEEEIVLFVPFVLLRDFVLKSGLRMAKVSKSSLCIRTKPSNEHRRSIPPRHQLLASPKGDVLVGGLRRRRGPRRVREDSRTRASRTCGFSCCGRVSSRRRRPVSADGDAGPADRLRHRGRTWAEAAADLLHRPHDRAQLDAGLAGSTRKTPLRKGERQICSLGRITSAIRTRSTTRTPSRSSSRPRICCCELSAASSKTTRRSGATAWATSRTSSAAAGCAGRPAMGSRSGATIRAADPNHLVLIGVHTASIDTDVGLRVDTSPARPTSR